jgi:hypothetical protein
MYILFQFSVKKNITKETVTSGDNGEYSRPKPQY